MSDTSLAVNSSDGADDGRSERRRTIFIIHPSDLLTDHRAHGDGLIAYGFISELARRGHRLHVVCENVALSEPPSANVTLHVLERRLRGPLHWFDYAWRVRRRFCALRRTERFDIAHQLNPVFPGLSLALAGLRVPIVLGTYVAPWPAENAPRRRWRAALESVAKNALLRLQQSLAVTLLVTTRIALDTRIVRAPRVRAKVRFQKHGVDTTMFRPPDAPRETAQILFVAALEPRKGIFTLIEAFARVSERIPSATLVVAGGGTALAEVRRLAAELGVTERIELLDFVGRDVVAHLMRRATVYCLPSFGEPYATSVIEAMASGLPVVVTRSGGLAELVDDEGGSRVTPGNAAELASALLRILESPDLARSMGEHNRRRAESEFSWEAVGSSLETAYTAITEVG